MTLSGSKSKESEMGLVIEKTVSRSHEKWRLSS